MRALLSVVVVVSACQALRAEPAAGAGGGVERTGPPPQVVEVIYERGLRGDWQDHGWADHGPEDGGAARLDLTKKAGWILANPSMKQPRFGGLVVRYRAPASHGDFLSARLDGAEASGLPAVPFGPSHRRTLPGGVTELFVSMNELNPTRLKWTTVRLRAEKSLPPGYVDFLFVGLTIADAAEEQRLAEARENAPGRPVTFTVDCAAPTRPISPLIYGVAVNRETTGDGLWELGITARRWGGNWTSRYNWALGNAYNTGSDWYFRNVALEDVDGPFTWQRLLSKNLQHRVATALTVPTLGWVAKDTSASGFPVAIDGPQQDAEHQQHGNGVRPDGTPLPSGPPTRTSVAAPPEFIGAWVKAIRARDGKGPRSVAMYILDNEPGLWHDTHRDVHPRPMTYDELLERTVTYGSAVRAADPDAVIAGPASWGWPEYFYSAADLQAGHRLRPDRRAHGDVPLLEWWLRQLAAHEKKTGTRLLDVLDVHFYPQGPGLGVGDQGRTDAETNALRIRSTRALWDPTYVDESWIKEPVRLIPRMREWVEQNYPGRKLSIGEYNFGAEQHPSGGVALAEALGRFGQHGLDSAFYWTIPPKHSPAWWAFRAYRDYDGAGAQFLDQSMPAKSDEGASVFAARDASGKKVTLVLLNLSPLQPLAGAVQLEGCAAEASRRAFTWREGANGLVPVKSEPGAALRLPPYSISVLELTLAPKGK
jgi:hypothetical protein